MYHESLALPEAKHPMYAIVFDMDTAAMEANYPTAGWTTGYSEIREVLEEHKFIRRQQSTYFGDMNEVNAVSCVLAIQDLKRRLPWFADSVRDIRMLRIEEFNDLMPVVRSNY